jgi:hypothetical protein
MYFYYTIYIDESPQISLQELREWLGMFPSLMTPETTTAEQPIFLSEVWHGRSLVFLH